jgi:AcrR family transcriptional regulator
MPPPRSSPPPADPALSGPPPPDLRERPLIQAAINRTMSARYDVAADEIARIVEAAYQVIERSGTVDPRVRDILSEAGLSTQAFYRHFPSKDDLLLVLLDDGRRRLADYLEHRMDKVTRPAERVRAWIEGVLAQAVDPAAAARTRPFLSNLGRLTEQHPDQQQASVDTIVALLTGAIQDAVDVGEASTPDSAADALAIYHLATAAMTSHVLARTTPSPQENQSIVSFAFRALSIS